MIKEIKMYTIICDRCGDDANDKYLTDWEIKEAAVEYSKESGWIEVKGKHYCQDCRDEIKME